MNKKQVSAESETLFQSRCWFGTGVVVGWLRLPHQSDSAARADADPDGPLLTSRLRRLQHCLHAWHHPVDADRLRRFPACSELRAHAGQFPHSCSIKHSLNRPPVREWVNH